MFISPSLASADVLNLESEMRFAQNHFGHVHLDIEDGVYLHNISFGFKIAKKVCEKTTAFKSLHLMVQNPLNWIRDVAECHADVVFIHVEHLEDPVSALRAYKNAQIPVGLGLSNRNLGSDISMLLAEVNTVLVLTAFIEDPEQAYNLEMHKFVSQLCCGSQEVWLDGGITHEHIPQLHAIGVEGVVLGRAIFNDKEQALALKSMLR